MVGNMLLVLSLVEGTVNSQNIIALNQVQNAVEIIEFTSDAKDFKWIRINIFLTVLFLNKNSLIQKRARFLSNKYNVLSIGQLFWRKPAHLFPTICNFNN